MSAAAWIVAGGGAALAAVTAAADGALAAPECRTVPGADDAHRALAMTRVLAYLALGAGVGRGVLREVAAPLAAQWLIMLALVACVLVADAAIRAAASARGLAMAARLHAVTAFLSGLLRPVVRVGTGIEALLGRMIPAARDPEAEREASAGRLRELLEAEGEVTAGEATLLTRAFALARTSAGEIMVPRVDIVGVEADTPWSEVLDRVRSSEHARLPVFRGTLDDVVGVLYAKDLLLWALERRRAARRVGDAGAPRHVHSRDSKSDRPPAARVPQERHAHGHRRGRVRRHGGPGDHRGRARRDRGRDPRRARRRGARHRARRRRPVLGVGPGPARRAVAKPSGRPVRTRRA